MSYALGVDLGTTYTAAAVLRDDRPAMVNLGQRAAAIPSVVFLREDDAILTGDSAVRRGLTESERVAREFKRRVGDPAPILLGGTPMSADALLSRLLAWTVDVVSEREGAPPDRIAVCHPANWGPYKLELLDQACRRAGLSGTRFVSEPEAAATHYAAQERVEPGAVVAVYDLGGGTFDAAVLRKTELGFELLGRPEGIERLGGIDFDEAVVAHVTRHIRDALAEVGDDPASIGALARLRQECVDAKEALSADSETSIPVMLPGFNSEVRLTRAEFESMIRVPLLETIGSLRRALQSSDVEPDDLAAILLVGGSSRIPMVAQMVSAELSRPVAVDADPKHAIALGAALVANASTADEVLVAATPSSAMAAADVVSAPSVVGSAGAPVSDQHPPSAPEPAVPISEVESATAVPPPTPEDSPPPPSRASDPSRGADVPEPRPRTRRGRVLLVGAVAVVAITVAGAVLALSGGRGDGGGEGGWVSACPTGPSVCITSVDSGAEGVTAKFVANDVELGASSAGGELRAVFFLTSVTESQASGVDARTSAWQPWRTTAPFQGFASGIGTSNAICVLVGNEAGQVAPGTGNCAELRTN